VGPLLNKSTNTITADPKQMAEIFADQYDSVFSTPSINIPPAMDTLEDINLISDITVSPEEIMDAIKELRPSSASGADGFPAILLTNWYKQLAIPLAILWKVSLQNTTMPDKLKFNIIPPIAYSQRRKQV